MKTIAIALSLCLSTVALAADKAPKGPTIATCKDGTESHSAHRQGACSRHGGVKSWADGSPVGGKKEQTRPAK